MGLLSALFPPSTTPAEAHEAASRREVVLLDAREPREFRAGHAPRSQNVPLGLLAARLSALPNDRRYVTVCRSGARSRGAAAQLRTAGFDAVNLAGGMHAWARAGLPLEPRTGRIV